MRVVIRGEQQDIDVTTVVLAYDATHPDFLNIFHCFRCRTPLLQHGGNVIRITPGYTQVDLPLIHLCPTCKKRFLFVSLVGSLQNT